MQLLEKEKKLSESFLWQLQFNAYTQFGPKAWSHKGVPFYVTSNPYTAHCYAQVVFGYIKDNPLSIDEPIYIFDLGAGTGRFAYLFLKEFMSLIENSAFQDLKFRYILTDIAKENFSFWQGHSLLKKYFQTGILDFCYYHHTQKEEPLILELCAEKISFGGQNPVVVIANYFFDTIPQDLFRIRDGILEEGLITLYSSKEFDNKEDPEIINHLSWQISFVPIEQTDNLFSNAPQHRELLLRHQQNFENATFLFPSGGLDVLDYFKSLSNSNMLLIAGDQGVATVEQMQAWEPKLSLHGSFSIAVSYYILATYFEENYGIPLLTEMSDPAFVVMAGILSQDNRSFYETEYAFKNFIDVFEPQDYWHLGMELEKTPATLEAILLFVKLGKFDPMNVYGFYENIRKELPFATAVQKKRLAYTLTKVEENFYPVASEDGAFIANLGVLFFEMAHYKEALALFQKAMQYEGNKDYLQRNIQACLAKISSV